MHACLLALLLTLGPPAEAAGADTTDSDAGATADTVVASPSDAGPSLLRDHAVVYGATAVFTVAHADVRNRIRDHGSWSTIAANFRDPVGRAVEGYRLDRDPFLTNYVAHPVSWALVGYYFRSRGHGFWGSLAMSQAHSVFWEYVIEGSYHEPSGKDLITNFAGSLLGIGLAGWLGADVPLVGLEVGPGSERLAALPGDPLAGAGRRGPAVALTVRLAL